VLESLASLDTRTAFYPGMCSILPMEVFSVFQYGSRIVKSEDFAM
jgi:hypothetical protein